MKNILKKVLSVAAATALLMTSVISASAAGGHAHHNGDTNLNNPNQYDGPDKYTITLTDPSDHAVVDGSAKYGAYQIFSGTVKGETYDGEDGNKPANPGDAVGTNNSLIPITDIKWGNAFGNEEDYEETYYKNIVGFVIALAEANDFGSDYSYAFSDFDGFDDLVNTVAGVTYLAPGYVSDNTNVNANSNLTDLRKVNFDKLAVAVADVIAQPSHNSREWLQDFADILGGFEAGLSSGTYKEGGFVNQYYGSTEWSTTDKKCTISVPAGYYMVLDLSDEALENEAYSARMLFVANNITQKLKEDVPTIDKKIERDGGTYETDAAGVGDIVTFQLTGTLPSNYDNYLLGYQLIFTDELGVGLTAQATDGAYVEVKAVGVYVNDVWQATKEIKIQKSDIVLPTGHDHDIKTAYAEEYKDNILTVTFPCLREIQVTDGGTCKLGVSGTDESKIIVTYKAMVNKNATVGTDASNNINSAKLTYSNNPQAYEDTGETKPDEAKVYIFGVDIVKVDAADFLRNGKTEGSELPDAKFSLVRPKDGTVGAGTTWQIASFETVDADTYVAMDPKPEVPVSFEKGYYTIVEWEDLPDTAKGAEFIDEWLVAPYNADKYKITSLSNGALNISGLNDDITYTLVETDTPDSALYAKIAPFTFSVKAEKVATEYNGELESATTDSAHTVGEKESFSYEKFVQLLDPTAENADDNGSASMLVANFKYTDLPSTGGIGVYIYYIAGGCVVALALVLFALSKKKKTTK